MEEPNPVRVVRTHLEGGDRVPTTCERAFPGKKTIAFPFPPCLNNVGIVPSSFSDDPDASPQAMAQFAALNIASRPDCVSVHLISSMPSKWSFLKIDVAWSLDDQLLPSHTCELFQASRTYRTQVYLRLSNRIFLLSRREGSEFASSDTSDLVPSYSLSRWS